MEEKKEIRPNDNRPVQFDTGSMLREWRVLNGLTQEQVARKAGIAQQQYQRFESGSRDLRRCSFQIACQVLEALDIDIVKFYHGEYAFKAEVDADQIGKLRKMEGGLPVYTDPEKA